MSQKNVKSILTTAMQNAEAPEETETTDSQKIITFNPNALKRAGKKVVIGALATASVYFIAKAIRAASDDETETSSED
jgi:hypothetical protein